MSLNNLVQICAAEQGQCKSDFACFEILRRALEDKNDDAWYAFETQFKELIFYWIHQDTARYSLTLTSEEVEDTWSDTLANFVDRYTIRTSFSQNFEHIGAVLKVFHKCVRSTLIDRQRAQTRQQKLEAALQQIWPEQITVQTSPTSQIEKEDMQQRLQEMIRRDLPEEELRCLLHLRFIQGLKPREIYQEYPECYPSVRFVNNQLDKIMKRLRRRVNDYAFHFGNHGT